MAAKGARKVRYRFYTREGGVSDGVYASFNVSYGVGDDPLKVTENRRRVKEDFGACRMVSARQVHGDRIYLDRGGETADVEVDGYDALITATPGTVLLVQQADCQGVLLHDPFRRVVAAVHCGWRGSVAGIIGKTIAVLEREFHVTAAELEAFIGPSLGPCCAEFVNHARELPPSFRLFQVTPNHFDFWQISAKQLREAGVPKDNIRIDRVCTCCHPDYFSYRRACRNGNGVTGRHGTAICLGYPH